MKRGRPLIIDKEYDGIWEIRQEGGRGNMPLKMSIIVYNKKGEQEVTKFPVRKHVITMSSIMPYRNSVRVHVRMLQKRS